MKIKKFITAFTGFTFCLSFVLCFALSVEAEKTTPTLANTTAPQGGTFYFPLGSEPERLNPINSSDLVSSYIQQFVIEGLMRSNPDTNEPEPGIAERFEADKNGKSYTFYLRKDVKFHNGEPVTAEVVKWNYDARMDDRYKAFNTRPYLDNIEKVEVIDTYTVKFHIKRKYFANFDVITSFSIMGLAPKSVYGDPEDKKANKKLVGSGPYILEKYNKGNSIVLKRNPNWWGRKATSPAYKNAFNFDRIHFRFVKEENMRMEMLKKGKLDYDELTAEQYVKKAVGKPWGTKVLKKEVKNKYPKSYGFVAWNFKEKMFQDRNTRLGLAHLMNRELMIKKFKFGKALPATGPWYQQSPYANKKVKAIPFNPKKAGQLFAKAGWKDTDKDGVLDKMIDGKKTPFRFSMMFASRDAEKYFTIYKEDLKKAGVDMQLKVVEWNSFVKALDEQKFAAVALAWGGGSVDNDPKQIWHSESAKPGGSNFISYSNKEVDKLIDAGRQELDKNKRIKMWNKVYKLIADDAPYAFMFNNKFVHYAVSKKIGMERETTEFGAGRDLGIGYHYWWVQ